jgi:hypothetical protein
MGVFRTRFQAPPPSPGVQSGRQTGKEKQAIRMRWVLIYPPFTLFSCLPMAGKVEKGIID